MTTALALTDTDWQLTHQIDDTETAIAAEQQRISACRAAIAAHEAFMAATFAREIAEATSLKEIYEQLLQTERLRYFGQGAAERAGYEHISTPREPVRNNRNTRRQVKALYRKIAQRCHPDATNDPTLHALFHAAAEALRADDLDGMQQIFDQMSGLATASKWASAHDLRVSRLKAKLREASERLAALAEQAAAMATGGQMAHIQATRAARAAMGDATYVGMMREMFTVENAKLCVKIMDLKERLEMGRMQPTATSRFQFWGFGR